MTQTIDAETVARIREALMSPDLTIGSGVGDADTPGQGTACTIAEIKLVLTGTLGDGPHPCISEVIRRWVIQIQDRMPADIRNSPEWRQAAAGIAGSASTVEAEKARAAMILAWMWDRLADEDVLKGVPASARESWDTMCRERTEDSARVARRHAADAYADAADAAYAAYAAAAAAYAYAAAAAAAAYAGAYAAAAAYAGYADAAAAAAAAADAADAAGYWTRADPASLLVRLIDVKP